MKPFNWCRIPLLELVRRGCTHFDIFNVSSFCSWGGLLGIFMMVVVVSTTAKVIHPKYSKQWPYTVARTIDCVCSKMLNHGLNYGLFLSLFKLTLIEYVLACLLKFHRYLNFKVVLALPKTACSAQAHKSISFIWIVWSTLYLYLWKFSQFFF